MSDIVRLSQPEDLDRSAVALIAHGAQVELDARLRDRLAARRHEVLTALAEGRPVYGVNTGMGARSGVRLSEDEQAHHQHDLLLARAVGGPPWLSRVEVRALCAARLRAFLNGDAGVSVELLDALIDLLAADVVAAVPQTGYGAAGEIIPLAHAFGPLVGIGSVLEGTSTIGAAPALEAVGLTPFALGSKEGIALLQGVPGATARAIVLVEDLERFLDQAITTLALSLVAVAAPQDPYRAELARGDEVLADVSAQIRERLAGSSVEPRVMQAAVSFRVAASVFALLCRSITALGAAIDRALEGVTDSPVLIDGEFRGTAGFHGLDLAAHLDQVAIALVHAAEVSAARTHRMLDPHFSGLPAQLAAAPGAAGLVVVHKRAAGGVHQLRRATLSSIAGTTETSFGQEDVQSFAWEAATNARTALDGAVDVLAAELLVATQAISLSDATVGVPLQGAIAAVRAVVPPIEGDRPFGVDIEALRELITGSKG